MRTDVVRLGRLSGERTGEMMHFLSSMRADRCIADADLLVDIAHVLMLDKQRIIDHDITKQLLPALLELHDEGIPEELFDDELEDVHAGIEALLIEALGAEAGGRMHMGRSRNDEVATCIRIKLREDLLKQMAALIKVREVLIALAELHKETVMPGLVSRIDLITPEQADMINAAGMPLLETSPRITMNVVSLSLRTS